MSKDIEKTLRDTGKNTGAEYPADKLAATRAEFTTNVRMMNKDRKGCCPLSMAMFAFPLFAVIGIVINI